jgi:hypothetical protein
VCQTHERTARAVGFDVAEQPDRGRASIGGEDRVRIGVMVDQTGKILRVNLSAMIDRRTLAEFFDGARMQRRAIVQERAIRACGKAWQKGFDCSLESPTTPSSTG